MSIDFFTKRPMDLSEAIELSGWSLTTGDKAGCLTDGDNYLHMGSVYWRGEHYLAGRAYGSNDVSALVEALDMVDEYDEWEELAWWPLPLTSRRHITTPSKFHVKETTLSVTVTTSCYDYEGSDMVEVGDVTGWVNLDLRDLGTIRAPIKGQHMAMQGRFVWDLSNPDAIRVLMDAVETGASNPKDDPFPEPLLAWIQFVSNLWMPQLRLPLRDPGKRLAPEPIKPDLFALPDPWEKLGWPSIDTWVENTEVFEFQPIRHRDRRGVLDRFFLNLDGAERRQGESMEPLSVSDREALEELVRDPSRSPDEDGWIPARVLGPLEKWHVNTEAEEALERTRGCHTLDVTRSNSILEMHWDVGSELAEARGLEEPNEPDSICDLDELKDVLALGGTADRAALRALMTRINLERPVTRVGGQGQLDTSAIATFLRRHRRAVSVCFHRASREAPGLHGRVEVRFTVSAFGGFTAVKVTENTTESESLADRIMRRFESFWQPTRPEGGVAEFVWSMELPAAQGLGE